MVMKLYHGDCLQIMKNIPNESIDLILADLPYGITNAKWDSVIPLEPLWTEYERIIKNHGAIVLFGAEPFSSNLRTSNLKNYRYDWIWEKTCPTGALLSHKMPMHLFENIMVFYKHLPIYNPQMRKGKPYKHKGGNIKYANGIFGDKQIKSTSINNKGTRFPVNIIKFKSQRGKYHPTQKPLKLLRYLVRTYTNKNMWVLDNVMGSGSTGVASKQLNRNFIGIEKEVHYFNIANLRINNTKVNKLI